MVDLPSKSMTRLIILAAGKGIRMNSVLPKVLVLLQGQPMIKYLMNSVIAAQVDPRPLVVVSPDNREIISQTLSKYELEYVIQDKQLGTGHAVNCARDYLGAADSVVVLYGDHPFLTVASIQKLAALKQEALTIAPTKLIDFSGWQKNFYHWGRIIRGVSGQVEKIVEFKDANNAEKAVTEVNPGFMSFNRQWLLANLDKLQADNQQQEYYLTDLVKIAFEGGYSVGTITIAPREAMGINSLAELEIATDLL